MNKIVYECIKDNIYLPRLKEYKIRNTARCILLNDKNEICLLLVDRDDDFGKTISYERLAEIFKELEQKGAHNINLVNLFFISSPTPSLLSAFQTSLRA